MAVLGGHEVVRPSREIESYADPEDLRDDTPEHDTFLGRLQRDLLHRRGPRPWRTAPDRGDASVQAHACHTRLREVQVLHDRLRALLDNTLSNDASPDGRRFDPPLQAREIAVLAPDIDQYRPHIEAVFGALAGTRDYIPYALADLSPLAGEPLAEVFLRLLALPASRFGVSEVLDLLATPAVSEAAGVDAAGLERLQAWLHDAGARWGLDPEHRLRHDAPADEAYTWRFALDRLLLGHASGDDSEIAGVSPWTELEGSALDALDSLIRMLRVLARHERLLGRAMPPAQWRDTLFALLDALLPERPRAVSDQRAIERLRRQIDAFAASASDAGVERLVPPDVVRAYFQQTLSESDTRAPLLTGGVSFARMVPMRLLPFRVICVLGLNDGEYPRRDPAGGLNKLAQELTTPARRFGDRSVREDDRFLFLQLFVAASEVLYLSYLGADPRDGSAREPSPLVSELLDVAARYHREPDAARAELIVHEPLQPFSPAAFGAGDEADGAPEPRRYSYRGEWRPAAQAGAGERRELGPWIEHPLAPVEAAPRIALADLRAFLRDPPGAFLRQRLSLRLPEAGDADDDVEPLLLPGRGLQRQQLQQAVYEALLAGQGEGLQARLRARALLPSGPLGRRQLDSLLAEVRPYAETFARWREDQAPQSQHFELELGAQRLYGRIDDVYAAGLARLRFGKLHGPAQIAHGLDWLVLSALGDARPLAQFAETGGGAGPTLRAAAAPAQARAALDALLRLRTHGLREPLPFLPRAGWLWYLADSEGRDAWSQAALQWHGGSHSWSEAEAGGARLALRGRDPFAATAEGAALADEFRAIARLIFDAVVHGRSEEDAR
jgi:exodeoxyribonuclease V gamma subunit